MSKTVKPNEYFRKEILGLVLVERKFSYSKKYQKTKIKVSGGKYDVIDIIDVKEGKKLYVTNTWSDFESKRPLAFECGSIEMMVDYEKTDTPPQVNPAKTKQKIKPSINHLKLNRRDVIHRIVNVLLIDYRNGHDLDAAIQKLKGHYKLSIFELEVLKGILNKKMKAFY